MNILFPVRERDGVIRLREVEYCGAVPRPDIPVETAPGTVRLEIVNPWALRREDSE